MSAIDFSPVNNTPSPGYMGKTSQKPKLEDVLRDELPIIREQLTRIAQALENVANK